MNVEYDLQPLQDYFNLQATPAEFVASLYKLIANYAKSVSVNNFEEMQDDISMLALFAEYVDGVSVIKNQSPKV